MRGIAYGRAMMDVDIRNAEPVISAQIVLKTRGEEYAKRMVPALLLCVAN